MFEKFLSYFFPNEKLRLLPEELKTTLGYYRRANRGAFAEVESEAKGPYKMMFVSQPDGPRHYTGFGDYIVVNRHL